MRVLRSLLGYTKLECQRNVERRKRLKVESTVKEIQTYHRNWKRYMERMQDERLTKLAFKYLLVVKRNTRRPKMRRKEKFLEEV